MINKYKEYTTRDGWEVKIYTVEAPGKKSVVGAIKNPKGIWLNKAWNKNGRFTSNVQENGFDLIYTKKRHKITIWVNVYDIDSFGFVYHSKLSADSVGKPRLACVKMDLDFEEGEGL